MRMIQRGSVVDSKTFAQYAHQQVGVPNPTGKDIAALNGYLKKFWERYPGANWETLCKVVDWSKNNNSKYYSPMALVENGHKIAWLRGYLPELDYNSGDVDNETRIVLLLEQGKLSADWCRRFLLAQTPQEREAVLERWDQENGDEHG